MKSYRMTNIVLSTHLITILSIAIYLSVNSVFSVLPMLFLLLLFIPYWWIGKRFDSSNILVTKLKNENIELEEINEKLRLNLIEYKQTFNQLSMYYLSYDLVKNEYFASKDFEDNYGFSYDELVKKPSLIRTMIHPDDIDKVLNNEEQLKVNPVPTNITFRMIQGEEIIWIEKNSVPILNGEDQVSKINSVLTDITERKQLEDKLKQMAYYDELTDLPNRKLIYRHLQKALARSIRHNHNLIVLFIDLDGFKNVNDTLGHKAGDILLQDVSSRLQSSVREEDLISRLGGDEFVIVFEETEKIEVDEIAKRIIDNISKPYLIDGKEANISPSIGISIYPDDGEDKDTLIQNADKAMYFAKKSGKNTYKYYTAELESVQLKKENVFDKFINTFSSTMSKNRKFK